MYQQTQPYVAQNQPIGYQPSSVYGQQSPIQANSLFKPAAVGYQLPQQNTQQPFNLQPMQQNTAAQSTYQAPSTYQLPGQTSLMNNVQSMNDRAVYMTQKNRKKYTREEADQYLKQFESQSRVNEQFIMLVRNLRVLEVIQRQIFNDPMKQSELHEIRSQYFTTINEQMKTQQLSTQLLRERITAIGLQTQLSSSLEYIISNTQQLTEYTRKLMRISQDCQMLLQSLSCQSLTNGILRDMVESIIDSFKGIMGKEGCPPLNWVGMNLLNQIYKEAKQKAEKNPSLTESWEHYVEEFDKLFQNNIMQGKWM